MELGSPLGWHGTVVYDFYEKLKIFGKTHFFDVFFQIFRSGNLSFVGNPVCLMQYRGVPNTQDLLKSEIFQYENLKKTHRKKVFSRNL